MFIVLDMKQDFTTATTAERQTINVIYSNNPLTMVGKCRTYTSAELPELMESPTNITACSSSIMVREKAAQGGGLDPFTDGDDHDPREEKDCHVVKPLLQ